MKYARDLWNALSRVLCLNLDKRSWFTSPDQVPPLTEPTPSVPVSRWHFPTATSGWVNFHYTEPWTAPCALCHSQGTDWKSDETAASYPVRKQNMFDRLYQLPHIAWIQLKVLTLIYRGAYWSSSQVFTWPYPLAFLRHLSSSLLSLDRHDLFVPRARTSMAQTRAFAIIGPSLWNQLLPSTPSTLLTGEPSASFRSLKTDLFSLGLSHWKRFWLVCTARSAIEMYRYNTMQDHFK